MSQIAPVAVVHRGTLSSPFAPVKYIKLQRNSVTLAEAGQLANNAARCRCEMDRNVRPMRRDQTESECYS